VKRHEPAQHKSDYARFITATVTSESVSSNDHRPSVGVEAGAVESQTSLWTYRLVLGIGSRPCVRDIPEGILHDAIQVGGGWEKRQLAIFLDRFDDARPGQVFFKAHPEALSQITENRKVATRKWLIFREPIFGFCLQKPTLRQSPKASRRPHCSMRWPPNPSHRPGPLPLHDLLSKICDKTRSL